MTGCFADPFFLLLCGIPWLLLGLLVGGIVLGFKMARDKAGFTSFAGALIFIICLLCASFLLWGTLLIFSKDLSLGSNWMGTR